MRRLLKPVFSRQSLQKHLINLVAVTSDARFRDNVASGAVNSLESGTISAIARKTNEFDAVILGAGAAGLLCAIEAGKRGRRVAIVERADRIGKKILISGGGRCNFTNLHCGPENFISANPHFARSALARYAAEDFIHLVEKHRIPYHEKTSGQLFCDGSAHEIVRMLKDECDAAGVQILLNRQIIEVSNSTEFMVRTAQEEFRAPALVVATGGLSIPKMGATGFGYDLARQFGVRIREPRPALVPIVFNSEDREDYCDLAGVSAEVVSAIEEQRFREKMLITHRGLSGPAILQISRTGNLPIRLPLIWRRRSKSLVPFSSNPAGTWPWHGRDFKSYFQTVWLIVGWTCISLAIGQTPGCSNWSGKSIRGLSLRMGPRGTTRPRSRPEESILPSLILKPCSAAKFQACFLSEKWWTLPGN